MWLPSDRGAEAVALSNGQQPVGHLRAPHAAIHPEREAADTWETESRRSIRTFIAPCALTFCDLEING